MAKAWCQEERESPGETITQSASGHAAIPRQFAATPREAPGARDSVPGRDVGTFTGLEPRETRAGFTHTIS